MCCFLAMITWSSYCDMLLIKPTQNGTSQCLCTTPRRCADWLTWFSLRNAGNLSFWVSLIIMFSE